MFKRMFLLNNTWESYDQTHSFSDGYASHLIDVGVSKCMNWPIEMFVSVLETFGFFPDASHKYINKQFDWNYLPPTLQQMQMQYLNEKKRNFLLLAKDVCFIWMELKAEIIEEAEKKRIENSKEEKKRNTIEMDTVCSDG